MKSMRGVDIIIALVVGASVMFGTGCQQQCTSLGQSYRRALDDEKTAVDDGQIDGASPAQFGLALHTSLVGDILDLVLAPTIQAALSVVSASIDIGGQDASVHTDSDILHLEVSADSACDHCFRVGADLDGAVTAEMPSLGQQSAQLDGSFAIVAPLVLERGDSADVALKLDLAAMAQVGRSSLSAHLRGVSDEVADLLDSRVSQLLLRALTQQLDAVTIAEFDAPSFGIPGLKIAPVQFVTDAASETVYAGFATNIDALNTAGDVGVAPITDLRADENFALAFQPAIISHALSLLIGDGQVSRTYNLAGRATDDGSAHITLDDFAVGSAVADQMAGRPNGAAADDANVSMGRDDVGFRDTGDMSGGDRRPDVPFGLGFQVFNLNSKSNLCFGFGAQAIGGVSARQDTLEVELTDVHFTGSFLQNDLVDPNNWLNADFITKSRTLVSQSLDKDTVSVPNTDLEFQGLALQTRPNAVVVRARSTAHAPDN